MCAYWIAMDKKTHTAQQQQKKNDTPKEYNTNASIYFFIGRCQFLSALFVNSKWHWMVYFRSSGFNVAHIYTEFFFAKQNIHRRVIFYLSVCKWFTLGWVLVLDLAQYVQRFLSLNLISFVFFSLLVCVFRGVRVSYRCHFHYFIILYQFFSTAIHVYVFINKNAKCSLWYCGRRRNAIRAYIRIHCYEQ